MSTHVVSQRLATLRQLRRIRHSVSRECLTGGPVLALVLTRLDHCKAVLAGLPAYQLDRLQSVINAAARLIYRIRTRRCDLQRFIYKLSVLTYKALHTGQPCYFADLIDSYEPPRCLRSTNGQLVTFLLFLPVLNHPLPLELFVYLRLIIGILSLSLHIRSSDNLATFQSRLKSHLFSSAYHV